MFSTAGYNLLLSQAATGEEEEEDEWEKTRQMLLAIRHLYCTHPPPFISVRSLSTSSAPSIATSSCKSKGGDFLCKQTTEHRYRYIQKKLLNHSLNVENAIVSSPNHVLFIWLGFAPFLFLLIVSRDRQEIRAFRLISNELIIPRGACPDLTEWGHAVESADEPVGQKTKEKHRGKKNTVLSKGKWCFKALLLHTVVKYANQPGRRWEHKQYWVSPDALSQLEERGIKHKGH